MGDQLTLIGEPDSASRVRDMCARAGIADATVLRYQRFIESWEAYCSIKGESVWDASTETVLHWLDHQMRRHTTRNHATMCLAAVRHAQRAYAPEGVLLVPYSRSARPRLHAYMSEVQRMCQAPTRSAKPMTGADLRQCVEFMRMNARPRHGIDYGRALQIARRNVAVMLVGWWGAMRSQEIVDLEWEDISEVPEGLEIYIRNSKTGAAKLALWRQELPDMCPVVALDEWRRSALIDPLYLPLKHTVFQMTRFNVCRIVRYACRDAGLTGGAQKYSSHSLRAGFATEAAAQGIDDRKVMRHARWTSRATHDKYVRTADLWENTPTRLVRV